ncbi:MAG: alpha-hydroxy-acid oxidizing protein [Gammaproteobacteria bacterium]|nr:alpha-hydroxy-acid oxidizing protein [Gammaproteobacteria bacterium]
MRTHPDAWDYLVGGTETETTLRRNRAALDRIALRPRVLRDVSDIDATASFLGKRVRLPVMLAPVGGLHSFHEGAGKTVAEGAGKCGAPMMLSSVSKQPLDEVRAQTSAPFIYQLYVRGDDSFVDSRVDMAVAAGCDAFCLTVDTAVYSRRERDIARRFKKPWRTEATGMDHQAALSWKDVARFKQKHAIPLVLKGIGTAEDARIALEHGVEVVYVSNHGGRQLDHGRGSMDVLPEVLDAVGDKAKVIVDGSFCRGTDVVKAMAMGVEAIAVGRLYCYALAAAGADGIVRMYELLESEVKSALGLSGATRYADLSRDHLHFDAPMVTEPHVFSAFPLLNLDDPGYGGR